MTWGALEAVCKARTERFSFLQGDLAFGEGFWPSKARLPQPWWRRPGLEQGRSS